MRRLVSAVLLLLFASTATAQDNAADIADAAIRNFILAGYERFTQESDLQAAAMSRLCASPGEAGLSAARAQFGALVRSWSRIEIIRFGPVLDENRLDRILFWPDRRSIALRQVQAVLAEEDSTATSLGTLEQKSVALQGLGALEYVLFGTGSELMAQGADFRCRYGATIGRALTSVGQQIVADWEDPQGIAAHMRAPADAYPDYRTGDEVLRELLGVWVHGMEMVRDIRIMPFFGVTAEEARPRSALFWRSGLTFASIRANLAGMRDLFILSGMADSLGPDDRWAGGSFIFELDNFDRTASQLQPPVEEALATASERAKLNYLLILTRSLQNIVVRQIAGVLGLGVGFSSLDGD
jgi:hypothetical protein